MATLGEIRVSITHLDTDLTAGDWKPQRLEILLARTALATGDVTAQSIRDGLQKAGPDVTSGRLAAVASHSAAVLDLPTLAASPPGQHLRSALHTLLAHIAGPRLLS